MRYDHNSGTYNCTVCGKRRALEAPPEYTGDAVIAPSQYLATVEIPKDESPLETVPKRKYKPYRTKQQCIEDWCARFNATPEDILLDEYGRKYVLAYTTAGTPLFKYVPRKLLR